jgi:hypothetical protein
VPDIPAEAAVAKGEYVSRGLTFGYRFARHTVIEEEARVVTGTPRRWKGTPPAGQDVGSTPASTRQDSPPE